MRWLCTLVALSGMPLAQAAADGRVVVVNSSPKVAKYQRAEAAFSKRLEAGSVAVEKVAADAKDLGDRLQKDGVRAVYCIGSRAYKASIQAAGERPLVFSSLINWKRLPKVARAYGVAYEVPAGFQLTMFRYFFPEVNRLGVLYSERFNAQWVADAGAAAAQVGVKLVPLKVTSPKEGVTALKKVVGEIDALWVVPDPLVFRSTSQLKNLFGVTDPAKKPVFATSAAYAKAGAALMVSADQTTIGLQAADLVTDLLGKQSLGERVQNPAGTSITLHMGRVEQLGLKLNPEALDSVTNIVR